MVDASQHHHNTHAPTHVHKNKHQPPQRRISRNKTHAPTHPRTQKQTTTTTTTTAPYRPASGERNACLATEGEGVVRVKLSTMYVRRTDLETTGVCVCVCL